MFKFHVCLCSTYMPGDCEGQERVLEPLEPMSCMAMSHDMGTEN